MVLAIVVLLLAQAAPPAQPRDTRSSDASGTAMLAGRIVDAATRRPVPFARIEIMRLGAAAAPISVDSGDAGEFEVKGLAAGAYRIFVTPPELQATHLPHIVNGDFASAVTGAARPSVELKAGEIKTGIEIRMERPAIVEGRVLDEHGEPIADAEISAERVDRSPFGQLGRPAFSDDRGMFRAFSLTPGVYRICATPSRNDRMGEPGADARLRRYAKTCYPSAPEGGGEPVTLKGESDPPMLTIVMQRRGSLTLSGRVTSESGSDITSVRIERRSGPIFENRFVAVEVREGQFTARGVSAGEYLVSATAGYGARNQSAAPEHASVTVQVSDADVSGVELVTVKGATLHGRVVVDGSLPGRSSLRVQAIDSLERMAQRTQPAPAATVAPDFTFEVSGVREPLLWDVIGLPPGWIVAAVRYRGEDVTDIAAAFATTTDASQFEIVVSPRSARLVARPVDANGAPVPTARVLMFPVNGDRWGPGLSLELDAVRETPIEQAPVRPGEYIVAAIPASEVFLLMADPPRAAMLKRRGRRVLLAAGDRQAVDVPVISIAEGR